MLSLPITLEEFVLVNIFTVNFSPDDEPLFQGFLYHSWGDRIEGEKCFKKALEIYEEVLSQDHVLIATCKYHLGMIYQEMRKWHQALQCFQVMITLFLRLSPKIMSDFGLL